jgi:tetratricopeptide (TPR) repeat protein
VKLYLRGGEMSISGFWRPLLMVSLAIVAHAQKPDYEEPPEEDKSLSRETEYAFNPLQASKEYRVGQFYLKKGSLRAAAGRFEEATKWNPSFADAFLRLAETREKLAANELQETERQLMLESAAGAYRKYLELSPDGDKSKAIRKKLEKVKVHPKDA